MSMEKTKNIIRKSGNTLRVLFCLFISLGVLLVPLQASRASHKDASLFGNQDGALDNTSHVNGIYDAIKNNWVAGLMMMTEQFVTVMMEQAFIIGTFFDAQQQLEVQRLFQDLSAKAHKEFHPSFQMCEFGTVVRSLAWADIISVENAKILDTVLEKREHLNENLAAAAGITLDVTHRIKAFKDLYCDLDENNKAVFLLCNKTAGPINRRTKDIDYPRVVDNRYTLDINFTDTNQTDTEKDIIALGHNLYAGTVIDFMPEQLMNETAGQGLFLETRSIHAIRSVARRSFANIVGMRAEGDQNEIYEVTPFLYGIVKELGVPDADIVGFLGENPSYFAQMEVLTRKIYQSPEFFTNLYDKPTNVRRVGVALQAIELMQDRDRFESSLRREMLISLIIELKMRKYQEDMNTAIFAGAITKFGVPEF